MSSIIVLLSQENVVDLIMRDLSGFWVSSLNITSPHSSQCWRPTTAPPADRPSTERQPAALSYQATTIT